MEFAGLQTYLQMGSIPDKVSDSWEDDASQFCRKVVWTENKKENMKKESKGGLSVRNLLLSCSLTY